MFQFSGILKQSVLKEKDGNQWMNLNDDLIYENKIKLKDEPFISSLYCVLNFVILFDSQVQRSGSVDLDVMRITAFVTREEELLFGGAREFLWNQKSM